MDPVQVERLSDGADLGHEQFDVVARRILDPAGPAATDLVVEHRTSSGSSERLQRLEVVVRASLAAMQAQHRQLSRGFAVTHDAVPGVVAAEGQAALSR